MSKIRKVAIFDWGIGGLTVLKPLLKSKIAESCFYFSDSGFTPYGKLSPEDMRKRLETLFNHAIEKFEVDTLVIGCNAASSAFIGETTFNNAKLFNVIEPTAQWINQSDHQKVGIIGGELTASTDVYGKLISSRETKTVATQILSALVEAGNIESEDTRKIVADKLSPFLEWNPEALILGCTHYPALSPIISELLPKTKLIDPAEILIELLSQTSENFDQTPSTHFFTSGNNPEEMKRSSQKAFEFTIDEALPLP